MSQAFFGTPARTFSGIELRRSTRIERTVPIFISGRDTAGQDFLERTSAVSVNLHGCRYPSRHDLRVGTWITLQLGEGAMNEIPMSVRAQVKSVHMPQSPRELHHVGVELETPGNIWSVPAPPADWINPLERGFRGNGETAAATGPARSSVLVEMPKPQRSELDESPKQMEATSEESEEKEAAAPSAPQVVPPKPGRLILTQDQLVNVLRGKLQQAAENAVREAMAKQFDPVMQQALAAIEETREGSIVQVEEASTQQRNTLLHATRSELLERLEERIEEVRVRWDAELDGYRMRAEEILNRVEKHTTMARRDLEEAKAITERAVKNLEPLLSSHMERTRHLAAEEFHLGAAQAADRHLVRLLDESQNIARETTARLEAKAAEALAAVESTARQAIEEFRRQSDTHAALSLSETTQRMSSSMASLEAQNQAACDSRRETLEAEVSRVGEKITEEFRQSFRAFFYSCLVAAVGAVEQHSKTTREGMTPDPEKFLPPKF
ncbi:MAG TPA: hypothetical protein VN025_13450 [Candidatus Dormibacteraeota bacterium]|nr:hypothetical protein [Candidatus Dormibacteraeota bacterium]